MSATIRIRTFTLILVLLCQCAPDREDVTLKNATTDPFINTVVASQFFEIDATRDHVLEGKEGTVIVMPQGCLVDGNGAVVTGPVAVELAEALSITDMLLSNLTTTSGGQPLETDGMIYFNATRSGEQLFINKNNPVHIEIPTLERKPGMHAYRGIRDQNGNMDWVDPKPVDDFLLTVNIDSLDFFPQGFRDSVQSGMPFRKHNRETRALSDSLYYSLSPAVYERPNPGDASRWEPGEVAAALAEAESKPQGFDAQPREYYGIDPLRINVIWSQAYQHTLLATREFERRLQTIFKTCQHQVLELYVKNLDKNLYEIDSLAAAWCEKEKKYDLQHAFEAYARQRLTKVKDAGKYAALLQGYYDQRLAQVTAQLVASSRLAAEALNKDRQQAEKAAESYFKLLKKREKYRMETYGFSWTQTGWVNIDRGTLPKDWGNGPLQITVTNGRQFDRVHTYVVYTTIKSLYRLHTTDDQVYYVGSEQQREMLMPLRKPAVAICIAYNGEQPSLAIRIFETVTEPNVTLTLEPSTPEKLKDELARFDEYSRANSIQVDLKHMEAILKKQQPGRQRRATMKLLQNLWLLINPCAPPNVFEGDVEQ